MASTPTALPINFDLYDENEDQVLYITDNVVGEELTLEISNNSNKPTKPKKLAGKASATNHHFELRFRSGVLYNNPAAVKLAGTQFEMFANKDGKGKIKPNADGTLSLYFKAKGSWTMQKGDKVMFQLNQIRAATAGGTRGTRMMLKYKNLLHVGNSAAFSGHKEMHLNIINHQGKKHIPLHVGFIGSNTVLNDGDHPNTLRLRITNCSHKGQTLEAAANSKLVLVAEGGPTSHEWTLATNNQLKGARVEVKYPGEQQAKEEHKFTGATVWEMPFKQLRKNQFIDVLIDDLKTNHPTGHANLYLHYENIPGFWDGQFVAVVEKQPLVFDDQKNVGIGTAEPNAKLEVKGNTKLEDVRINGNILLEPDSSIRVNRTAWEDDKKKFITFLENYKNDTARGQVHLYAPSHYYEPKPLITLAGNYGAGGKVGIDNPEPEAMLDVNGEIKSKKYQFLADNKKNPEQQIDKPEMHIVKLTKKNDPYNVFDDPNDRFVASVAGYYFFSTNISFALGNGFKDPVFPGIIRNGDETDKNSTLILTDPSKITSFFAQSVTSIMSLDQGDFVDVRLYRVKDGRFFITHCSFMGMMISK